MQSWQRIARDFRAIHASQDRPACTSLAAKRGPATLAAWFAHLAQQTALWTGQPAAFLLAVGVVVAWIMSGPIFNFSDTWQLVINIGTTIVTFLMVSLIQNTQNRHMMAVQLKLSELVLGMNGAKKRVRLDRGSQRRRVGITAQRLPRPRRNDAQSARIPAAVPDAAMATISPTPLLIALPSPSSALRIATRNPKRAATGTIVKGNG